MSTEGTSKKKRTLNRKPGKPIKVDSLATAVVEKASLEKTIHQIDQKISQLNAQKADIIRAFDRATGKVDALVISSLPDGMKLSDAFNADYGGLKTRVEHSLANLNKATPDA